MSTILTAPENWHILTKSELKNFVENELGESGNLIIAAAKPKQGTDDVFAVLTHQKNGYIAQPNPRINQASYIQKMQEDLKIQNDENGLSDSEKVRWKGFVIPPKYDSSTHTLDYGVALYFGHEIAINLYRLRLVRNGALTLTLVGSPKDHLSLIGWNIQVDASLLYQNHQASDRIAEGNLENLMLMTRFI